MKKAAPEISQETSGAAFFADGRQIMTKLVCLASIGQGTMMK